MLFSNTLVSLPGHIIVDNAHTSKVINTKFLGLHIDGKLNWRAHITYLSKLLSRNAGVLNNLKIVFPKNVLNMLYSTLILPYLNYGILAWGNAARVHLDRLLLIQKRAIRIVCGANARSHTDILFYENRLLKVHDLYLQNLGSLMYQLFDNELPCALASLFVRNDQVHSY